MQMNNYNNITKQTTKKMKCCLQDKIFIKQKRYTFTFLAEYI